jgi:hypothetical protein
MVGGGLLDQVFEGEAPVVGDLVFARGRCEEAALLVAGWRVERLTDEVLEDLDLSCLHCLQGSARIIWGCDFKVTCHSIVTTYVFSLLYRLYIQSTMI